MSVAYHFFFQKTTSQKYFFQILSQKNAQIVNLKNPDLDLIRRIHPECGFYGFMIHFSIRKSGFGFSPKNTPYFIWPLMPQSHLQNSKEFLAGVDESRANKHKYKKVVKSLPFWNKLYTLTVCDYMISDVSWGARFRRHFLQSGQNYNKMYGTEPRFNEILVITNTIHKHSYKIYLNITNKINVSMW